MGNRLDVLIVNHGDPTLLARCLQSVRTWLPDEQVRVWDNRSPASPQVRELATTLPEVDWTFSDEGIGYAAGMNRLVVRTDQDTFSLNPDAELTGPLTRTREVLRSDRVAAASPAVVDPSGRTPRWDIAHKRQNAARILLNHAGYADRLRRTPFSDLYPSPPVTVGGYLTGCSLLVRREAWAEVGLLDERFFVYGEDPEWQRRAQRHGWRIVFCDEPDVRHGEEPGTPDEAAPDDSAPDDSAPDEAPAGPVAFSDRMRELRAGNTAVALDLDGGRGHLVTAGDLLLGRVQRSKRTRRAAVRTRRAATATAHDVVLTVPTLEPDAGATRRVELANALAGRGHPVTLVCTEAFGPLQRALDPGVRLLLRPWWLPVVEPVVGGEVLIAGRTPAERRFAAGWARLGATRTVVALDALAVERPDLVA